MPIERKIYYCEHCMRRRLMDRRKIEKHEKECWSNPENKSCLSCYYSQSGYISDDASGGITRVFDCALSVVPQRTLGEPPATGCQSWVHHDLDPEYE